MENGTPMVDGRGMCQPTGLYAAAMAEDGEMTEG